MVAFGQNLFQNTATPNRNRHHCGNSQPVAIARCIEANITDWSTNMSPTNTAVAMKAVRYFMPAIEPLLDLPML